MTFEQFLDEADRRGLSLVVVNRTTPAPLQTMVEDLFEDQPVTVQEDDHPDADEDMVYLVEDETVVASSPMAALEDAILLVNSDLYITGGRPPAEVELPAVLDELEEVRFQLRGYPESNNEKLLLITISRYIERLALESDGGKHRASFQRLSRINDERGTRWVYEKLADSPVDTHVYGVPDWTPPPEFEVTMHGGWTQPFQDVWFVTFVPDDPAANDDYGALVAVETSPRVWEGFWTYDSETVERINGYIEAEL